MARHRWRRVLIAVAAAAVMATPACGSPAQPGPPPALPAHGTATVRIGGRPVTVHVPSSYDPARPAPLIVGLHGYSSNAAELESYLRLTAESDRRGFISVYPDGTTDDRGDQFWNATDACCAFAGHRPDDSRYLSELITTVEGAYRIDPARVGVIGHSNGGFMAFRMACDHAGQVAAIVSLNGATWNDPDRCRPSEPVSVLAVRSSADPTIVFGGGYNGRAAYPSAADTVTQWLGFDHCAGTGRTAPRLDLDAGLPGPETTVVAYERGCAGGSTVQAWTITGGSHVPRLGPAFTPAVTGFLLSRAKPAR